MIEFDKIQLGGNLRRVITESNSNFAKLVMPSGSIVKGGIGGLKDGTDVSNQVITDVVSEIITGSEGSLTTKVSFTADQWYTSGDYKKVSITMKNIKEIVAIMRTDDNTVYYNVSTTTDTEINGNILSVYSSDAFTGYVVVV